VFVTVRPTPDSEPLFATSDPRVVAAVLRVLVELAAGPERPRLLRMVDRLDAERGPRDREDAGAGS
jgi:hypothetical protein